MLYISCKPHRLYSVQGLRDLESSKSSETLVLPRTTAIKGVMKMVGATRTVTMKQAPSVGLPPQGRIYYFAYGSNMEPSVLTDRRKVKPVTSRPGVVPGWVLSFRLEGLPYAEPAFATIERRATNNWPDVHGVVHEISKDDWLKILRSEGVGPVSAATGYRVLECSCDMYGGDKLRVLTLEARPGSLHPTARAPTPSARYKGLLVTGAQASGIKPEYVQFLENLPVYSAPAFSAQLGRLVVLGAALPLALPILPPLLFQRWVTSRTQQQQGQEESHTHSPVGSSSSLGPTTNSHSSNGAGASAAGAASAAPVLQQTTPVQVQSKSQAASGHASADGDIVSYPAGTPVQGLPYAPTLYFAFLHRVVWGLHDYLLAPLLGSGATPPPGAATYPGANNKTKA